jgi:hypothetical protein
LLNHLHIASSFSLCFFFLAEELAGESERLFAEVEEVRLWKLREDFRDREKEDLREEGPGDLVDGLVVEEVVCEREAVGAVEVDVVEANESEGLRGGGDEVRVIGEC